PPQKYGPQLHTKLEVDAPTPTSLLVLSPQVGGMKTGYLLKINGPAGEGYWVNVATDRGDLVEVPSRWAVPKGQNFVASNLPTKSVSAPTSLKISASQAGKTLESTLTL